ncbi:MAG: bifunctional hydroxymethylpyrimidine kinase/phosphomethylpyrimidine kinase [Paludibacteraceae bacterium]|nr:bifunctional hydroxymethylpyrimidine kinase/phosphomethylpyrimidine kinase [Paludibacteraceae bacterium]
MEYKKTLTIAGSDPSGGAGIQADIKTMSALGCYAASAITAVVDENTCGVTGVMPVPPAFVKGQIKSVMDDIEPDAIKIGMVYSQELVEVIAETLSAYSVRNIVVDPVMVATSGDALSNGLIAQALMNTLMPLGRIITPNIPEAETLLGEAIGADDMEDAARRLSDKVKTSVLLKAGHIEADTLTDILYNAESGKVVRLSSPKVDTVNTHGTGCTLSSAIASFLAHGESLDEAVGKAKEYISSAIREGANYKIGHGHGPVHHFHNLWK